MQQVVEYIIHTIQVQQDEQHHPIHRYMCSSNPVIVLIHAHVNRQADISIVTSFYNPPAELRNTGNCKFIIPIEDAGIPVQDKLLYKKIKPYYIDILNCKPHFMVR